MRKLGLILGLLAFAGTPWLVHADTILFKDGFLLHGKLLRQLEPLIDPSGAAVFVPAAGKFFELDDEARRFVIVPAQVQDARSTKLNVAPDYVEVHRTRTARGGYPLDGVFEVIDASGWDKHFERTIRLRVARKGQDQVDIHQRMTLLTPHLMRVDARTYNWTAYYLTREIAPQVVLKLLRQHFDDLNQKVEKDPKQKGVNDPKENRLKICRFLSQAGLDELAEKEMNQVVKDLPDLKEKVDQLRERVAKARAILFVEALERADKAGQRQEVKRRLAQFHGDNMQALVGDKLMLQVQDLKSRVEAADDKFGEAGRLLAAFAGRLERTPKNEPLAEAAAALRTEMHPDLLPRLEAFVSLGQQWEKDAKAGRAAQHNAEGVLSLALTGWLLGASAAEASPETAEKLWKARQIALRYQNTPAPADRQNLLRAVSPNELPAPEVLAQLIRYLPPPEPHPAATAAVQKTLQAVNPGGRPIQYEVQLPPEYHPSRAYPVLVVLHSSDQKAKQMLDRWSELAAKNGYILAAPQWGRGGVFQSIYAFSPAEHAIVLNCLRNVRRRFRVDDDRVFLFGAEQGGFFAYDVGLSHPSQFAGVLTMAASPAFFAEAYWSNAQYLPLYVVDGGANGAGAGANRKQFKDYVRCGYPALYVEYKGRGPEWFGGELPAMFDWMNRKKRFFPVRQVGVPGRGDSSSEEFRTMRPGDGPYYWLEADRIAPQFLNSFANWQRKSPARVQATVAANNRVLIHTKGVGRLTVWLMPGLVDFKKKVSVQVNLANQTPVNVQPSVAILLEDYYQRGDRTRLFVAKLTVTP